MFIEKKEKTASVQIVINSIVPNITLIDLITFFLY
jgi:hypothetical protein